MCQKTFLKLLFGDGESLPVKNASLEKNPLYHFLDLQFSLIEGAYGCSDVIYFPDVV